MDDATWRILLDDLAAEALDLTGVLAGLSDDQWSLVTPAAGWNIHDQVVHLAFFDEIAALGFTHPEAFADVGAELLAAGDDYVDRASHDRREMPPAEVLSWFRMSRSALGRAYTEVGPSARTPWFGPPMSAASSATARLMETWAHGQDVYDTLDLMHPITDRARHVCHLGVITRDTQRRHLFDTALQVTPGAAAEWMSIAQVFAGAASAGRPPHHVAEDPPR